MNAADLFQRTLAEDPDHDPTEHIDRAVKSAILRLVDALAYADGNPNRAEYIAGLIDLCQGDEDPATAMLATATGWLRDLRTEAA